jgi:hypothetical protein
MRKNIKAIPTRLDLVLRQEMCTISLEFLIPEERKLSENPRDLWKRTRISLKGFTLTKYRIIGI